MDNKEMLALMGVIEVKLKALRDALSGKETATDIEAKEDDAPGDTGDK